MVTHRTRLISMLIIEIALIALHVLLRGQSDLNSPLDFEWHGLLALFGGVALVTYALSIRCPIASCRRHQVFRGMSVFDLRLPGERCYVCNAPLERAHDEAKL